MMVVHEDNERPVEVAVIRKPLLEQKSYVIVKNHVRELPNTAQNVSSIETKEDKTPQSSSNVDSKKKKRKSAKIQDNVPTTSMDSNITNSTTTIDSSDLEELRSVYMKCKEVMNRIETKYGHLLDLDTEDGQYSRSNKRKLYLETSEDECNCELKKKIVFDDDGRQITVDGKEKYHVCAKKLKHESHEVQTRSKTIAVEYNDVDIELPDDLNELSNMLQSRKLANTTRNNILNKIRLIKQEYANDIRFNRHILIEKLKTNPDDVLDFKGTNLSSIPGYS